MKILIISKRIFLKSLMILNGLFFNEVKTFKEDILKMHKTTPKITDNQEQQMITLLHNDIIFLEQQLQQKDTFIDSLIKQLSVQNEFILQQKCSVIQKETYKQQPLQHEIENRTENSCEKSITPSKSSSIERSVISPNTTITEPFVQEEAENRDSADNKKIDERKSIVQHEKETDSGKNSAQDPANRFKSSIKSVVILGDSMTKSLNGYEMAKKTSTTCKIYVQSFSGATTADMEDYMKPSVRKSPDYFILHVGTNDLSATKSPLETANEIINLACKLKTESHDVSVSTIILRGGNNKLNEKGCEVNSHLKELCKEKNIYVIDNSKKIKLQHLNKGKLHLTKYGSRILSNNFIGNI